MPKSKLVRTQLNNLCSEIEQSGMGTAFPMATRCVLH